MARKVILACAGMSLLAHAMAVTLWSSSEHLAYTPPRSNAPAWQVRSVSTATLSLGLHAGVTPASEVTQASVETNAEAMHHHPEEAATPPMPSGGLADAQTGLDGNSRPDTMEATAPTVVHTAQGWSDYVPRPQLSVPPLAQAPVLIAPPAGDFEPQRISGILSLYINEYGAVDHISAVGSDLPPAFEEAAITAFRHVTFTPGQLDGQAVKSRIKVEVVFDNTPLSSAPDEAPPH